MPPYQVYCSAAGCKNAADYKIAGRWSDGIVGELKTYGLCCDEHLRDAFLVACAKQKACHLTPGETLEAPGIFHLCRGQRDQALARLTELEAQFAGPIA